MSEESLVTLQVPADYEGEVTTAPWLTVAQDQLSYDDEYFDSRLEDGELLALLFLDDYHTRKLVRRFVLIDDERVLIFDESGRRIDDVDACIVNGQRQLHGNTGWLQEFHRRLSSGRYSIPTATSLAYAPEAAPEAVPEAAPEPAPESAPEPAPEPAPEAAPEPAPDAWRAVVVEGARVAFSFGMPAAWYGGMVGMDVDGLIEVAFDDGDLKVFPHSDLEEFWKHGTIKAMDGRPGGLSGAGGLVANEFGHAKVHSIYRMGKKQQAVGVCCRGLRDRPSRLRRGDVPVLPRDRYVACNQ